MRMEKLRESLQEIKQTADGKKRSKWQKRQQSQKTRQLHWYIRKRQLKAGPRRVSLILQIIFTVGDIGLLLLTARVDEKKLPDTGGVTRLKRAGARPAYGWPHFPNFFRQICRLRALWKLERPDIISSFIGEINMMAILQPRA